MTIPHMPRKSYPPLRREARSSFAQYAIHLREARSLTQADLAEKAKVNIATIKNIEGDRAIRIDTLCDIYRDALAVPPTEFQTLAHRWLERYTRKPLDLTSMVATANDETARLLKRAGSDVHKLLHFLAQLPPETLDVFIRLAKLAGKDRGGNALRAVSFILDYSDK